MLNLDRRQGGIGVGADRRQQDSVPRTTKDAIADAALATLKEVGYRGASGRAIARIGGFNQALIFYHYGSVDGLLLSALEKTSVERLATYREAVRDVRTFGGLIEIARRYYQQDLDEGHMTVVAEMVAGSVSDPDLRPAIAARMHEWVDFIEEVLDRFLEDSSLRELVSARDLAFAVVAFYLGVNIMSRVDQSSTRIENLFATADRMAALVEPLLGKAPPLTEPPPSRGAAGGE
jgi:AcrR family transcriptional regulator